MLTQFRSVNVAQAVVLVVVLASHSNLEAADIVIVTDPIQFGALPGEGYNDGVHNYGDQIETFNPAGGMNGPGGSWGAQWSSQSSEPQAGEAKLIEGTGHGDFINIRATDEKSVQIQRAINVNLPENTTTCFLVDVCLKGTNPDDYGMTVDFKDIDDLSFSLTTDGFTQTIGGATESLGIDSLNGVFYRVFGKIEYDVNGTDDRFSLWVFEEDGPLPEFEDLAGTPADNVMEGDIGMSSINRLGVTVTSFTDGMQVEGGLYGVEVVGKMEMDTAVPEPATLGMGLLGIVGLALTRRRRRRVAA